jgi:DUF1680 family protein
MAPRLIRADERVDAVRGCVAIARGPIVYCVEQADLPEGVLVEQLRLNTSVPITEEREPSDLTPVRLRLAAIARPLDTDLYAAYQPDLPAGTPITVTAIPYHAWANRGPGAMRVWLPVATDR